MRGESPRSDRVGGPEPSGTDPAAPRNEVDQGSLRSPASSQRSRPANRYAKRSELHRSDDSTFCGPRPWWWLFVPRAMRWLIDGAALREASASEPGSGAEAGIFLTMRDGAGRGRCAVSRGAGREDCDLGAGVEPVMARTVCIRMVTSGLPALEEVLRTSRIVTFS